MPAASDYFTDPDGHSLEYLAILPEPPRPDLANMPLSQCRDDLHFGKVWYVSPQPVFDNQALDAREFSLVVGHHGHAQCESL